VLSHPGGSTGMRQQHQRQQAGDLAARHPAVELTSEPDRPFGEVGTAELRTRGGGVPLVEHEVEHWRHVVVSVNRPSRPGIDHRWP
jgi:hypothetical protein